MSVLIVRQDFQSCLFKTYQCFLLNVRLVSHLQGNDILLTLYQELCKFLILLLLETASLMMIRKFESKGWQV